MPPPTTIDLVALAKGTFKRLAWAYGCTKAGSAEEAVLEQMLRDRVMAEATSSAPVADGPLQRITETLGLDPVGDAKQALDRKPGR